MVEAISGWMCPILTVVLLVSWMICSTIEEVWGGKK
jgi:hypothetical protein